MRLQTELEPLADLVLVVADYAPEEAVDAKVSTHETTTHARGAKRVGHEVVL
jgi:hypothetical protein